MDPISTVRRFPPIFVALALLCASFDPLPAAVAPTLQQIGYTPIPAPNACLPDSVGFRTAYQVYERSRNQAPWSRLLLVYQRAGHGTLAHAYCVFRFEGQLWTYDQVGGSQRTGLNLSDKDNAEKLGRQLATGGYVRANWVDSML